MRYELAGSLVIRLVNSAAAEATNLFDKNKIKFSLERPHRIPILARLKRAMFEIRNRRGAAKLAASFGDARLDRRHHRCAEARRLQCHEPLYRRARRRADGVFELRWAPAAL